MANELQRRLTEQDQILAYLKGDQHELSDEQQERVFKIELADRLLMQHKNTNTVFKMMQKKYPGLHRTTIYRIISDAQSLFGPIRRPEKDYARRMLIDDCWKKIQALEKDLVGNAKSIAAYYKVLVDAYGFKFQEQDYVDPSELGQHNNLLVIKIDQNKVGTLDLNKFNNYSPEEIDRLMNAFEDEITDADFEDITNE